MRTNTNAKGNEMKPQLQHAIIESIQQDRRVPVEYNGTIEDCVSDLDEIGDGGDIDYSQENDGSYEVWSTDGWRLAVDCVDGE